MDLVNATIAGLMKWADLPPGARAWLERTCSGATHLVAERDLVFAVCAPENQRVRVLVGAPPEAGERLVSRVLAATGESPLHLTLPPSLHHLVGPFDTVGVGLVKLEFHLEIRCIPKVPLPAGVRVLPMNHEHATNLGARAHQYFTTHPHHGSTHTGRPDADVVEWQARVGRACCLVVDGVPSGLIGFDESGGAEIWISHPHRGRGLALPFLAASKSVCPVSQMRGSTSNAAVLSLCERLGAERGMAWLQTGPSRLVMPM